jgi:hypothetical protein
MGWLLLPASAVLLDAAVVGAGVILARSVGAIAIAVLVHVVVALGYGFVLSIALGRTGRETGLRMALLGAAVALFVPLLGSVGLLVALHALVAARPKALGVLFLRFAPPDALTRRPPTELLPSVVTDRLVHLVRHGRTIDTRFRAVLRSNEAPAVVAVPVLKAALSDGAEEVRLSAFSQLEKTRRAIDLRIEKAREELGRAGDGPPAERRALHAALAQDYHEIAYLGLAEGEVYRHALKEALAHAENALAMTVDDGPTLRLVARIRLRQAPPDGPAEGVREALDAARAAGIPLAELATDYAEEAFRRRAFGEVAAILGAMDDVAHDHVLLAKIQEFWRWR